MELEKEAGWVGGMGEKAKKEIEISEASSGKGYKPFNFVYILNVTKINLKKKNNKVAAAAVCVVFLRAPALPFRSHCRSILFSYPIRLLLSPVHSIFLSLATFSLAFCLRLIAVDVVVVVILMRINFKIGSPIFTCYNYDNTTTCHLIESN